jgi:exosortase family protein XrtM
MIVRDAPVWQGRSLTLLASFAVTYGLLQWLYQEGRGTGVERLLIDTLTVRPSAAVIQWLTPWERVMAQGHSLVSPHARLNVLNGCEGTECLFLLWAAVLAYPAAWARRLNGLFFGTGLIYGLNQVRIVGLYYAARHDRELFQLLHGTLAPTLIILLACLFFLVWAQTSPRPAREPSRP